jgi:hypothetical protein
MHFDLIEQILDVLGIYSAALRSLLEETLGNKILLPLTFNSALQVDNSTICLSTPRILRG